MKTNNHCIQCELLGWKRRKRATHFVKEGGEDIPLCDEHYEEWLSEEELRIDKKEEDDIDGSDL